MSGDENDPLARLLGEAFEAQARGAVGDHARPPAPRFADADAAVAVPASARRGSRSWAPLAAAAAVIAIAAGVLGLTGAFGGGDDAPVAGPPRTSAPAPTPSASTARVVPAAPGSKPVRMKLLNADGVTYGVGMPVVAYFSKKITDGRSLQAATTATVNGRTVQGAWYFAPSAANPAFPIEGHFRTRDYWPAHSKIHVGIAAKGLSAGTGLGFGNDLTLDFRTGAKQILTVDDTTHRMTVSRDGARIADYPVSLGARNTPTERGIKVIMDKGRSISMSGPGYYDPNVEYTQQLTYSGEYLHSAPWNLTNIAAGVNSANGCTNMRPGDAKRLFGLTQVGDVVTYPNADGPAMQFRQGYGDWNVPWNTWLGGGLVGTR